MGVLLLLEFHILKTRMGFIAGHPFVAISILIWSSQKLFYFPLSWTYF